MGKGKTFSDSSNDDVYRDESDNENFVLGSQQNAQGLGGGVFNDSSGYGNFSQSGRDQRNADLNGALFRGNLGFILDTAVLDVTTSTINLLEDGASSPLARASVDKIVTLSSGSTSDLITILGAQRTGQRLRLYNIDTNTITIKNTGAATENTIFTPGADDFVLSGNEVVDLTYDITTAKWRVVGSVGSGGTGISFPILYPKVDLTPAVDDTVIIDVSLTTGNAKQIQFPAGNISFEITGDPTNTVGEDFYVVFIQDSVGGRSLTSVDSRIKDGGLMDELLDKAADAHTLFRFATLGGGTVYHPILVNLSTSTDIDNLSTLAIDTDKDWAGRFITNLAGLDLFTTSGANDITNMGVLTFVSDAAATRGQFGRSDFFAGAADGLVTNIPNTANISWSIDLVEKFRLDAPNDKLISSVDLDMNEFNIFDIDQARFIESSGVVSAVTDSVILLNSSSQFQFNTSETNDFVFSLQNIPAFVIDRDPATSDQVIATIQGDNTNINSTANLNLSRTFEPSATGQTIGQIGFNAPDNTNAGILEYAAIVAKIEDAADSFIEGSLSFDITQAGSVTPFLTINAGTNGIIDALKVLDMNSNDILSVDRLQMSGGTTSATSVNDVVWYLDADGNLVSNINATDGWIWTSGNIAKMVLTDSTLEKRNVTAPVFQLYNTRTAQVGTAGTINILANTANTSTGVSMGFIISDTEVATTDGSGSLKLGVNLSGVPTNLITLNDSDNGFIDFFTDLDMNDFALNNVSSISISDTSSNIHGLLQGLIATGVRLTLTAGEQFNIFDNVTNIFQMDSTTGLQLFGNDLVMGTGGNITSGGAGVGMTSIGHLDFVDNEATPVAALSIYSDGTDMLVNTGGSVVNLSDVGDGIFLDSTFRILGSGDPTKQLAFEVDTNVPSSSTVTMTIPNASGTIFINPAQDDLDLNTFDIFDIDKLAFMDFASTGSSLNIGFSALGSGGFRANFLDDTGKFEVTQENVLHFEVSAVDDSVTVVDWLFSVLETVGDTSFQIAKFNGRTEFNEPTQIDFDIGGVKQFEIVNGAINFDGANGVLTNVDQIGFRNLGNIIQDDTNGMIFNTPVNDDFTWSDGTTPFAVLDIDGLFLNQLFIQFTSIASPAATGFANVGELFMDSGNSNHLSIIRNGSAIDLEAGGGETNTASNLGGGAGVFAQKSGVDLEFKSLVGGTDISIVQTSTELTLNFNGTTGEVNTASNVGTGVGKVFKQKSGVDLEFKSILAGSGMDVVNATDDIQITANPVGAQDAEPWIDGGTTQQSGEVYMSNSKQGSEPSEQFSAVEDTAYFVPIFIAQKTQINRLGWQKVDNIGHGTMFFQMGIYSSRSSDGTDGQNYPFELLASGSTTADSTQESKTVFVSALLNPGLYWLAIDMTTIPILDSVGIGRHETLAANSVGFVTESDDFGNNFVAILGYAEVETSLPSTVANNMTIIAATPPALFYRAT